MVNNNDTIHNLEGKSEGLIHIWYMNADMLTQEKLHKLKAKINAVHHRI